MIVQKHKHKRKILVGLLIGTFGAATILPALADDVPGAAQTDDTKKLSAKVTQEDLEPATLSKVTVTAQKRIEYLQDVPVTMQTFNQQQLKDADVHNIKDLQILVPDLSVTSSDSEANTTARIRGVGTTGDNAGLESSVGIVIDGVPRPRNGVGFNDLGELSEVEVLKGPQGTLFGKNTSAGVINITTKRPTFDEQGYVDLTAGNYNALGIDAMYNNAASDTVAYRFYVADRKHDGYNNVYTNGGPRTLDKDDDQDFYTVRGQVLIVPNSELNINLSADYTNRNENCCAAVSIINNPGVAQILNIFAGGPGQGIIPVPDPSNRLVYANDSTQQKIVDKGVAATVNWNPEWMGNTTLTSITAIRQYSLISASDLDFSGAELATHDFSPDNGQRFNTFSQELRLAGTAGKLDWLTGLYFDNVRLQRNETITEGSQYENYLSTLLLSGIAAAFPAGLINTTNPQTFLSQAANMPYGTAYTGVAQRDQWNQDSKSAAAFANASYKVTDDLTLTGGLRYTNEEKSTDFNYSNPNGGLACGSALTTNSVANALLTRGVPSAYLPLVVPTVIGNMCLPWENPLFNGLNAKNSFTENPVSGTFKIAYRIDENFLTYASAARGDKAGGFNLARVQSATGQTNGGSGVLPVTNTQFPAEYVDSYELGTKTTWDNGNLLFNAALFESKFMNYQLNTFSGISWVVDTVPQLVSKGVDLDLLWQTGFTGLSLQGATTYTDARYGDQALADPVLATLPGSTASYAPKWTVTGGVVYKWMFAGDMGSRFNINARYTSDYGIGATPSPLTEQSGFTLIDARLSVGPKSKSWAVDLWINNLANKTYEQVAFDPALQTGSIDGFLGAPRTFGATFHKSL